MHHPCAHSGTHLFRDGSACGPLHPPAQNLKELPAHWRVSRDCSKAQTSFLQEGSLAAGPHCKGIVCSAGKTLTAPLDRVKLLLQTRGGLQAGALKEAARGGGVIGALAAIGKEEGFLGYWKGNVPQVRWPCF